MSFRYGSEISWWTSIDSGKITSGWELFWNYAKKTKKWERDGLQVCFGNKTTYWRENKGINFAREIPGRLHTKPKKILLT